MKFVPTALVSAFCIFLALGEHVSAKSALPNSRSVFVDCCLGRQLLCKRPPAPRVWARPTSPKLIPSSQICDGKNGLPARRGRKLSQVWKSPVIPSGFRTDSQTFYPVGSVVTYDCLAGFVLRNGKSVTCDGRGFWTQEPVCERLCTVLPSVENGSLSAVEPLHPGTKVIVSCNNGYLPLGNNFVTCASDGSWIGTPACVRQCGPIPKVLHSVMDTHIGPLVDGAVVTFSCIDGYSPMRNNFFRCDSSGSWLGTIVCLRVCPVSELPTVVNTQHPVVTDPLTVGSVVTYTCNSGFAPAPGTNTMYSCDGNGRWTGDARCFRLCPVSELPTVVNTQHPVVTDPLTVGSVVAYTCNSGFAPAPGTNTMYSCDGNGRWTGDAKCFRLCPVSELPTVVNTQHPVVTDPLTVGSVVAYTCNSGFAPAPGTNTMYSCDGNGRWTGDAKCFRQCLVSDLPTVINAQLPVESDPLTVDSVATYTCNSGFTTAPGTNTMYTCGSDGNWAGSATCFRPVSKVILCSRDVGYIACPVGMVIEVQTVMYGRTQGNAICPGGDVSNTNCISTQGFAAVSAACNSQTMCRLEVDTPFFNNDDPCAGIFKYLEMEYTCN